MVHYLFADIMQELRVFAFESDVFCEQRGQRYFLVTSYEQFWHYYK